MTLVRYQVQCGHLHRRSLCPQQTPKSPPERSQWGGNCPGRPCRPDKSSLAVYSSTLRDSRKWASRPACQGGRPAGTRGQIHHLYRWKDHHQNPLQGKNGSSNTQTTTSQTASTNWTGQSRLFCSGWELDTANLMPTCTTNSRLASLRCAHATQTSWLQKIYCNIVHYMMLWGGTHGRNRRFWGTSSMVAWGSWGGQPPSWGQQASPSSVRRRRRRLVHFQPG